MKVSAEGAKRVGGFRRAIVARAAPEGCREAASVGRTLYSSACVFATGSIRRYDFTDASLRRRSPAPVSHPGAMGARRLGASAGATERSRAPGEESRDQRAGAAEPLARAQPA